MKQYTFVIARAARKFIESQPKKQRDRIFTAIFKLPHEGDITPMTGRTGYYRLRVGTYRIIYTIKESILTVEVLDAGNRGDVY